MGHCTPDELMDVIEGLRDEGALPHLADCAACRDELRTARQTLAAVQNVPVPEPPPFAMEQLSARVMMAVAAEPASRPVNRWRGAPLRAVAAVAATALVAVMLWPSPAPAPPPVSQDAVVSPAASLARKEPAAVTETAVDDPSMVWMMELADGLAEDSWPLAEGLSAGAADVALDALSADEQRELARLIKEAIGSAGA